MVIGDAGEFDADALLRVLSGLAGAGNGPLPAREPDDVNLGECFAGHGGAVVFDFFHAALVGLTQRHRGVIDFVTGVRLQRQRPFEGRPDLGVQRNAREADPAGAALGPDAAASGRRPD